MERGMREQMHRKDGQRQVLGWDRDLAPGREGEDALSQLPCLLGGVGPQPGRHVTSAVNVCPLLLSPWPACFLKPPDVLWPKFHSHFSAAPFLPQTQGGKAVATRTGVPTELLLLGETGIARG